METKTDTRGRNTYTDIDSIFDTRLPLLYMISPYIASKVSNDGSYLKRVKDSFDILSYDIFRSLYRNRSKEILRLSAPNGLIGYIRQHYGDETIDIEHIIEDTTRPILYVNTHPYNLTIEEKKVFTIVLEKLIHKPCIEFINVDNSLLTPIWLDNKGIDTLFKYDALDWLEYHTGNCNLINHPLLTTSLIAPALLTGNMSSKLADKSLFQSMMVAAGTVIDLMFIDAIHFSTYITKK